MLEVGTKAPDFEAVDQNGELHRPVFRGWAQESLGFKLYN